MATPYPAATPSPLAQSKPSLWGLLGAQFLGAFNDNVHKIVLSMLAANIALSNGGGSGSLSLIGAIFVLPYLLFSGYAGHVADTWSKRAVLITTKAFEVVVMLLGFGAFLIGSFELMLGVLFLMAVQSTFFSPAKYGILPELVATKDLSRANGVLEMSTFLAIILGTSLGSLLYATWQDQLGLIGLLLIALAVVGTLCSLRIPQVASGAAKPFCLNPWAEIVAGIRRLRAERAMWLTVIGIAYFWFVGALVQMNIILFGKQVMAEDDLSVGLFGTFLAAGIGCGSLLAGRLSGNKIELGLVPIGSIGIGVFLLVLSGSSTSYLQASIALSLLGLSGGLFIVPLNAFLQHRSGAEERGVVLATSNFLSMAGVLSASGVLWLLHDGLQLSADRIMLISGLLTLAGTVYLLRLLPDFLVRFTLWLLTHTVYRVRIVGQQHVPLHGPALLICNHVSFADGLIVGSCIQRFLRFLVYRPIYEHPKLNWFMRLMKAIPVSGGNAKEVVHSLELAREQLRQGHVVCIFAEGQISRTGNLLPFKRGFERIVKDLDVPIIPVHLDRLWGSIFSFENGRFFWKRPKRLPYPVTVSFGSPLPSTTKAEAVRHTIAELGQTAVAYRRTRRDLLHLRFIATAKQHWFRFALADSTGKQLSYGKTLIASILLARWLRTTRRHETDEIDETMVGLLLPASTAGVVANLATLLAAKIPVNLNFTAGREAMASMVTQCQIRTVLTSKVFVSKAKLEKMEGMVFLEDVLPQLSSVQKIGAALTAFLLPSRLLQRLFHVKAHSPDSLATVIFSSGSTGEPKGIMLSHHNVLSNVEGIDQLFDTHHADRIMGVLPLFHSFGFTGTVWLPLLSGFGAVYHTNPLDAKTVGELVARYQATIIMSTPTFYNTYVRKCSAADFASLRYAIAGAEKLRDSLAQAFKAKYGINLLEGYGCTEMGPVVSVNAPNVVQKNGTQIGYKPGTVGHPLPGVVATVVDPDTREPRPTGHEGLLLVKGPSRMLGYLNAPDKTSEVIINDDWYVTGDIAALDEDGFIRLTDRLSRFSKIGGEMVPHLKIEETIQRILHNTLHRTGEAACLVTALADEQKGERLAALYTDQHLTPEALWDQLCQTDLPRLWIPKRECLHQVDSLPLLGTGKADLRTAKQIALERAAQTAAVSIQQEVRTHSHFQCVNPPLPPFEKGGIQRPLS